MLKHPDSFVQRHLGPSLEDRDSMLKTIGVSSLDELIAQTVPQQIRLTQPLQEAEGMSEYEYLRQLKELSEKNQVFRSYIGLGYYDTVTPSVILRNIFENPGWYTQYTPYQAEIAQGRLEALLNFQTMISDLTGLPVANASLLDEGTAAAEAISMTLGQKKKKDRKSEANTVLVDAGCFPQTIAVIQTRAEAFMLDTFKDKGLRRRMVEQLEEKGITNSLVLDAMREVPRHLFVDRTFASEAYLDRALPIDSGQTISSPFTVAYQSELLKPKKKLKILEIGTGSGYQAAVLAAMGMKVFTVEREKRLHDVAKARLKEVGAEIRAHLGDGSQGWPLYQPYERILVTAAAPSVPLPLQQQLEVKGILVAPVGTLRQQIMTRMVRTSKDEYKVEQLLSFHFVPLKGRYGFGE